MKKFTKIMLSVAAVTTVSTAMAISAMADDTVTGTYASGTGVVTLGGVVSSGDQQTLLVLTEDAPTVTEGIIAQIDQDAAISQFVLPANLESGTYYIRIGGSDGTIQRGTLTIGGQGGGEGGATVTLKFGDSDKNGKLNSTDSAMLARAITSSTKNKGIAGKTFTIDGAQLKFGDSDKNDKLNSTDSAMLARAITSSTKNKGIAGTEVAILESELNN